MRHARFLLIAGVAMAGLVRAQDLPPEVLLLSRVKNHLQEDMQRLPNISCLETVQREHQPPKSKMRSLDTVRLEVLTDGHKELFASPGGRKFSEQEPISFVGSGLMGTGVFGPYLTDVLLNANTSNEYKGEENVGGRRLARYDYRLPLMWSGQTVRIPEGSGRVGLRGSYWVDPLTYDVVRLELNAEDIPPTLPITEMTTIISYARTRLRDNLTVLLPESAELHIAKFSGEVENNRTDFTQCRVFGAETKLSFGVADAAEEQPRFGVSSVDDTLRPLPPGLQIAVKLHTRISDDMPVGSLIDGVVAADVLNKHKVVITAGSPVRGRIRRLEHYTDPFTFYVVALEFTEVELEGIRYRFYADPVDIEPIAGLEQTLGTKAEFEKRDLCGGGSLSRQRRENLFLPDLVGVASFFFKGNKLDLPPGFRTVWKTRPMR